MIVAMLAVALKDPKVQNPARYFGKLATWDNSQSLDLRLNLARILRSSGQIGFTPPSPGAAPAPRPAQRPSKPPKTGAQPAPSAGPASFMNGPGAEDPVWVSIDAHLKARIRTGAYGSWFARLGFHGLDDGDLHLSTPNETAAISLKNNYLRDIINAAEDAGYEVRRVIVTARRPAAAPPSDPDDSWS